jgi:outer membrane lipoprotein SlyB
MKTLISHYPKIKDKLNSRLNNVNTTEDIVRIVQEEIDKLTDISSDYIQSLTPAQARLAKVMLQTLSQYTNILLMVKPQLELTGVAETPENQLALNQLASDILSRLTITSQTQQKLQNLTSGDYYKRTILQQIRQSREVVSSIFAGGLAGTLEGGFTWGLVGATIGAATGAVIGKIIQNKKTDDNTDTTQTQLKALENNLKINIDNNKLLDNIYQALQSIDLTVAAYVNKEETAAKEGLENNLDLLEYLQELMADALDEKNQLPISTRRRMQQATTILRNHGIEARVYQPTENESLMFYFEPSIDPENTEYITLKHALIKDNKVLLPGYVIEPTK